MDLGTYFEKFKGTGVMVNGVRVPRKSQVKILSFFEAKLPLAAWAAFF
jgi:hypothetical protein